MRHAKKKVTLDRKKAPRVALLKNLAAKLIIFEKLVTTDAKAKATRSIVEKLITKSKKDNLSNRRQALSFLPSKKAVKKLFEIYGVRFAERKGGYTRSVKLKQRVGDGAQEVLIEFVD